MPWPTEYDSSPPKNDDNDYIWNKRTKRWEIYLPELSCEQEAAAERQYERSRKRAEWDEYHPGEPCPKCELE